MLTAVHVVIEPHHAITALLLNRQVFMGELLRRFNTYESGHTVDPVLVNVR